jgi:hypothetical protein
MNGSQAVEPVNFNAKKFAPERASQITARKISFGNMRYNTIDLYHKSRYALVMSKKKQNRPRKRDNQKVRREIPSEAREAFLDKCGTTQYNNRNTEVRLWTTRLNLSVYQAEMQRSTQRIFPLETEAVGVNRLQ